MSDRLRELQRQRALAQEQVAWFDREIAKEVPAAPSGQAPPAPVAVKPLIPAAADPTGDEILAQYRQHPQSTERDIKRGCYIWFSVAMGTLALLAAGIYLLYSRRS